MSDCLVCIEPFNSRRVAIACPYSCGLECCSTCHEKYLLDSAQEPHCMQCRREWSVIFMEKNFPKTTVTRLKRHRNKLIMAKDMSHLPRAQTVLEMRQEQEALREQYYAMKDTVNQLGESLGDLNHQIEDAMAGEEITRLKGEAALGCKKVKCPLESCRGFMVRGTCGTCHQKVCMQCYRAKEEKEEHKCVPEDVENVKYLKAHSKPCPKCGIRTSKTEGCSQMFCIECKTAWNWNTGAVEKGIIHNPHFFEWQRQNQGRVERNPQDIICGGLPDRLPLCYGKEIQSMFGVFRGIEHDAQQVVPHKLNTDLQIRYLENTLDKKEYARRLGQRDHMQRKQEAFRDLNMMFRLAATDIFQRLLQVNSSQRSDLQPFMDELNRLKDYYNEQGKELCRYYKDNHGRFIRFITASWMRVNFLSMYPEEQKKEEERKQRAEENRKRKLEEQQKQPDNGEEEEDPSDLDSEVVPRKKVKKKVKSN